MVDISGMTGMIILGILALVSIYIILSFIKGKENENYGEEELSFMRGNENENENDNEEESSTSLKTEPVQQQAEMSDEEFLESYTDPIINDAMESLESGIDSINSGLDCYDRGLWEEASNDFHIAAENIDKASGRLKEVPAMIEDESSKPVIDSRTRMDQCRLLRAMAIRMEEASDAMVEGNVTKARDDAMVRDELEKIISSFNDQTIN